MRLHFLLNAQSGLCPEDCHYCSQSAVSTAEIEKYPFMAREKILAAADRAIIKALADKDADFLRNLPRNKLNAGSSEILNWVALGGASEHLDLDWFEYVPGYRTPAGTGTGLSFATLR